MIVGSSFTDRKITEAGDCSSLSWVMKSGAMGVGGCFSATSGLVALVQLDVNGLNINKL